MNLPNKLTIGRILVIPLIIIISLIPFFRTVFIFETVTLEDLIVLIIFALASLTDMLDGKIARKYNLVTNFGKFMDPLADKLLVLTALIWLIERGKMGAFGVSLAFCVTIILAREFAVTGLRLIAASNQNVIAASKLGKSKTVSQMVMIILLIINCYPFTFIGGRTQEIVTIILVSIATILTILSGVDYFIKNKDVLKENNK